MYCVALWKTYPPNANYGLLSTVHKAPILDLRWSLSSPLLYTVSADHTLAYTDLSTGQRVRRLRAHREVINSVDTTLASGAGVELVATASDDGTVRVWEGGDEGTKESVAVFEVGCPVTSVAWSADGATIYAAALDNEIHVSLLSLTCAMHPLIYCDPQALDLRKKEQVSVLTGHSDTPCSLALSPNGEFLLSASFSSQTIIHDVRPFSAAPNRVHRVLSGAPAGFEQTLLRGGWSREDGGRRVGLGGADRTVTIWDVDSGKILYKLPGHKGTVTSVDFHPKEPIGLCLLIFLAALLLTMPITVLTGSKDGTLLVGEIDPSVS
jgi:Prp8 binding protein